MYGPGATTGNTNQRRVLELQNLSQGQFYGTIGQLDDTGRAPLAQPFSRQVYADVHGARIAKSEPIVGGRFEEPSMVGSSAFDAFLECDDVVG